MSTRRPPWRAWAPAFVASACGSTHTQVDVDVAIRRSQSTVVAVAPAPPAPPPRARRWQPAAQPPPVPAPEVALPPCGDGGGAPPAVVELALGPHRTCTRHVDGRLCCWGANAGVQGSAGGDGERAVRPARVEAVANVVSVGVGSEHVCALAADGSVWCWGRNTYGQLGDGTTRHREDPAPVPGLANVDLLGVGQWHTCARVRGDGVRCWGGNMRPNAAARDVLVPTRVEGADDVARFALGVDSCAVTASRGLRCWGNALMYTYRRPDALGGRRGHYTLAALRDVAEAGLGWGEASAGDRYACARERGGALWCWGGGYDGGHDRATGASRGRMAPVNVAGIRDATALAVAGDHACVIRAGGKLWCWGDNRHGQVGDGTDVARSVPVEVSAHQDVTAVAVAEGHTCARTRDGALWCWGRNASGELGDGTAEGRRVPTPVRWAVAP